MERQTLHPPSPASSSASTAASSEEEGLHACPLPHILGEYICDVAVYFGGGRIGIFSLLAITRCTGINLSDLVREVEKEVPVEPVAFCSNCNVLKPGKSNLGYCQGYINGQDNE